MPSAWRSLTRPHLHQERFKTWRRGDNPEGVLHRHALLEAGLGCGKSLSAIEEILELLVHRPRAQVLILVRNSNRHTVWAEQLREHAPSLPFTVLDGPRKRKKELLETDGGAGPLPGDQGISPRVWVHSHEDLPGFGDELASWHWDMIVIDECAAFRTASAQRTGFLIGRRHPKTKQWSAKLDADFKLALSGLPMIKGAGDLYPILRWLEAWPGNKQQFDERFLIRDEYRREVAVVDPVGLLNLLDTVRFQVPKGAVLNIPRTWRYDRVPLPKWQRDAYRRIQRELRTRWTGPDGKLVEADIRSRLSELLRLAQVAAGFEAIDRERWRWHDENAKTRHLLDVVMPECEDEKVIVWGVFKPEVANLARLLEASGRRPVTYYGGGPERDRQNQLSYELWKRGQADVFVSTLAKGSIGLNLPEASVMVFHSRSWATEFWVQALSRNDRLTTTHKSLRVVVIEAEGTVDQHVTKVLGDDLHVAASLTSLNLKEVLGE